MAEAHSHPTLNMSAVVQATRVQPDTLRAWERRYGMPRPGRSEGGHRLYSRRDVEVVKWLRDRQEEGLRISQAVELWRTLEGEGRDPLHMSRFASSETSLTEVDVAPAMAISRLKDAWVAACLAYDEAHGENILAQAFAIYPPEAVCAHLLVPALAEIGEGWYRHDLSVQQEHFASELAVRHLEALLMATPPPTRSGRILVACPPHERHRFPPLMLTFLLRRGGWDTLYLGENVPLERLDAMLAPTHPTLIVLAAQTLPTAADLLDMALFFRERGIRVAYGGLIFTRVAALQDHIPGLYLGDRLERAPFVVEQALASPIASTYTPASAGALAAARLFDSYRTELETIVRHRLESDGIQPRHLIQARRSLGDSLQACLRLGSLEPLRADMDWLAGLLGHFGVDRAQLGKFLTLYAQTARTELPAEAEVAVRWLEELAEQEAQP
jgi:DNA-binding transcriptional MerR regulator